MPIRKPTRADKKLVSQAALRAVLKGYLNGDQDVIDDMDHYLYDRAKLLRGEYENLNTESKVKRAIRAALKDMK
jgi:hypothetical protein